MAKETPLHISEKEVDLTLRPQTLADYIGQSNFKENLTIFIQAALARNETLDHVLLYGPPGLGKTTLAHIIAHEMQQTIRVISGPAIEKTGDLAAVLSSLEAGEVLFIDEIHRLPKIVEEVLYSAMEDFTLDIVVGSDSSSRTIQIDLPPFTLVGATTRAGDLTSPLRDRFGITNKLDYYTQAELEQIIKRSSQVLNVAIEEAALTQLALRSRGTPRIANRLLRRIRDFAQILNDNVINERIVDYGLKQLKIDELGLDEVDLRYLEGIIYRFNGGPVGLDALANSIGEEKTTLEDVYEPYLLQIGFINRSQRGRIATEKAYQHLKVNYQTTLFNQES